MYRTRIPNLKKVFISSVTAVFTKSAKSGLRTQQLKSSLKLYLRKGELKAYFEGVWLTKTYRWTAEKNSRIIYGCYFPLLLFTTPFCYYPLLGTVCTRETFFFFFDWSIFVGWPLVVFVVVAIILVLVWSLFLNFSIKIMLYFEEALAGCTTCYKLTLRYRWWCYR